MCLPLPRVQSPFLVTGLGGCGTHATSSRLQRAGIKAFHERLDGQHGAVCWTYAANDMLGPVDPWGGGGNSVTLSHRKSLLSPRFLNIVHLVREPVAHISSFSSHLNKSYEFVLQALSVPVSNPSPLLTRWLPLLQNLSIQRASCPRSHECNMPFSALAYLLWNDQILAQADAIYRIEDDAEQVKMVTDACLFLATKRHMKRANEQTVCSPTVVLVEPKTRVINHTVANVTKLMMLPFWKDIVQMSQQFGYNSLNLVREMKLGTLVS